MPRIDRIRIHNFRGASMPFEMEFEPKKKLVVIFGENGTGKTTIVDALDAIGNGSGGSVAMKSSTTLRDHLPTAGKVAADMVVEADAAGTRWQATLNKKNGIVISPQPGPRVRVLRRVNLQRFIDGQPAKRFEEVKHLIGVDQVQRSEDALKRALDGAKQQLDEAVRTRSDAEERLEALWRSEGAPRPDWDQWAKSESVMDADQLMAQARQQRTLREAIEEAQRAQEEWAESEAGRSKRRQEAAVVEAEVARDPGVDAAQAMRLAEVLEQARDLIAFDGQVSQCPICEQAVPHDLRSEIDRRLDDLERFGTLAQRRRAAAEQLRAATELVEARRTALIGAASRLTETLNREPGQLEALALGSADRPEINDELASTNDLVAACATLVEDLLAREEASNRAAGRVNAIRQLRDQAEASRVLTEDLEQVARGLAATHAVVRATRLEFTQRILDDVADECNRLYAAIHPGEGLAITKVELDKKQRASLNQTVRFGIHDDVPPQAYFSEAHLDTLGFCFWLAFAMRECRDGDAVLVLDDVFSSVDASHMGRITSLVEDECRHFAQTIITTHQRGWRDRFANSHGAGKLTELIELQPWHPDRGIASTRTPLAIESLAAAVDATPLNRQAVASQAGILLEAVLDQLALQYRCRLVRKQNNAYTLDELLSATADLFKKLQVCKPVLDGEGHPVVPPKVETVLPRELARAIHQSIHVRNEVGAHFNERGAEIPDAEVRAFGVSAVQLVRAVTCDRCGKIPSTRKATYLTCSCPEAYAPRMSPLQV